MLDGLRRSRRLREKTLASGFAETLTYEALLSGRVSPRGVSAPSNLQVGGSSSSRARVPPSSEFKELSCCVCLLPIQEGEESVAILEPCRHFGHADCVAEWAKIENTCPMCRVRFRRYGLYTCQPVGLGGNAGLRLDHVPIVHDIDQDHGDPLNNINTTTADDDGDEYRGEGDGAAAVRRRLDDVLPPAPPPVPTTAASAASSSSAVGGALGLGPVRVPQLPLQTRIEGGGKPDDRSAAQKKLKNVPRGAESSEDSSSSESESSSSSSSVKSKDGHKHAEAALDADARRRGSSMGPPALRSTKSLKTAGGGKSTENEKSVATDFPKQERSTSVKIEQEVLTPVSSRSPREPLPMLDEVFDLSPRPSAGPHAAPSTFRSPRFERDDEDADVNPVVLPLDPSAAAPSSGRMPTCVTGPPYKLVLTLENAAIRDDVAVELAGRIRRGRIEQNIPQRFHSVCLAKNKLSDQGVLDLLRVTQPVQLLDLRHNELTSGTLLAIALFLVKQPCAEVHISHNDGITGRAVATFLALIARQPGRKWWIGAENCGIDDGEAFLTRLQERLELMDARDPQFAGTSAGGVGRSTSTSTLLKTPGPKHAVAPPDPATNKNWICLCLDAQQCSGRRHNCGAILHLPGIFRPPAPQEVVISDRDGSVLNSNQVSPASNQKPSTTSTKNRYQEQLPRAAVAQLMRLVALIQPDVSEQERLRAGRMFFAIVEYSVRESRGFGGEAAVNRQVNRDAFKREREAALGQFHQEVMASRHDKQKEQESWRILKECIEKARTPEAKNQGRGGAEEQGLELYPDEVLSGTDVRELVGWLVPRKNVFAVNFGSEGGGRLRASVQQQASASSRGREAFGIPQGSATGVNKPSRSPAPQQNLPDRFRKNIVCVDPSEKMQNALDEHWLQFDQVFEAESDESDDEPNARILARLAGDHFGSQSSPRDGDGFDDDHPMDGLLRRRTKTLKRQQSDPFAEDGTAGHVGFGLLSKKQLVSGAAVVDSSVLDRQVNVRPPGGAAGPNGSGQAASSSAAAPPPRRNRFAIGPMMGTNQATAAGSVLASSSSAAVPLSVLTGNIGTAPSSSGVLAAAPAGGPAPPPGALATKPTTGTASTSAGVQQQPQQSVQEMLDDVFLPDVHQRITQRLQARFQNELNRMRIVHGMTRASLDAWIQLDPTKNAPTLRKVLERYAAEEELLRWSVAENARKQESRLRGGKRR